MWTLAKPAPLEAEDESGGAPALGRRQNGWGGSSPADWEDHFRRTFLLPRLPVHLRLQLESQHCSNEKLPSSKPVKNS